MPRGSKQKDFQNMKEYNEYRRKVNIQKKKNNRIKHIKNKTSGGYYKYITSKLWKKKKEKVIKLRGNFCEICGTHENIHLHHLTYERLFMEPLTDLQLLCVNCHAIQHEGKPGVYDYLTREYLNHNF